MSYTEIKNTWAVGLNPTYAPMSHEQSKFFCRGTLMEFSKKEIDLADIDLPFGSKIIAKRIAVLDLPIKFTPNALTMGLYGLCENPGHCVTLLIDCLNAFENKTVNMQMLAALYPTGFYDERTFDLYVDFWLKPKKIKWAEVY